MLPGAESRPFEDFRKLFDELPHGQQVKAIGSSVAKLIDRGTIEWGDAVTSTHVLSLKEIVAEQKLILKDLTKAGVPDHIAHDAIAAVHTPIEELARQRRQALIDRLKGVGLSGETLRRIIATGLIERISVGSGLSGTGSLPSLRPGSATLVAIIQELGRLHVPPRPQLDGKAK